MKKKSGVHPFIGSGPILIVSQAVVLFLAFQEKSFLESQQITPPQVSAGVPLVYFFVAVGVIGVTLFLLPRRALKILMHLLFMFTFGWGVFVALFLFLPLPVALAIAAALALLWFIIPMIWLHNLLLAVTLVSIGAVFGVFFVPWTAIVFMLVISVYDILAVRFGFMMWMVKKLSVTDTLPAFVIPQTISGWGRDVRKDRILDDDSERDFSVLGGGDIGFPLLFVVSVFFAEGFTGALIVAGFSVLGLAGAYLVQSKLLKGKPTPALPPISLLSIIGYLIVYFI
jgi:presenilin-like A22 family membrane protease